MAALVVLKVEAAHRAEGRAGRLRSPSRGAPNGPRTGGAVNNSAMTPALTRLELLSSKDRLARQPADLPALGAGTLPA